MKEAIKQYEKWLNSSKVDTETKEALNKIKGFVRTELGREVKMRKVPEIVFKLDESIENNISFTAMQIDGKFLKKVGPLKLFDSKKAHEHALDINMRFFKRRLVVLAEINHGQNKPFLNGENFCS